MLGVTVREVNVNGTAFSGVCDGWLSMQVPSSGEFEGFFDGLLLVEDADG